MGAGFSYGRIALLGLTYWSAMTCVTLFNVYVPVLLREFVASTGVVGIVMSIDNIASLTLAPWCAALSDRVRTRFGRRLPFLIAGMPLAAAAFPLLPLAPTLGVMMFAIVVYDVAKSISGQPGAALMIDLTPEEKRSQANALYSFMGNLGALTALFAGSWVYRISPALAFGAAAVFLLVSLAAVLVGIREPETAQASNREAVGRTLRAAVSILREHPRLLCTLVAVFSTGIGHSAIEAFFTTYAVVELGWHESTGAFLLGFLGLAFFVFIGPAGVLAARWGLHVAMERAHSCSRSSRRLRRLSAPS